ncbi:MAG: radical SAM protein [Candidatus Delongbacteria bacterium]|nr:radical SAM protein [Candidatus Delongbacteria bacterium]MBN2835994.1 radical SAM protein [Candidatus Delongbacteria bacterium]
MFNNVLLIQLPIPQFTFGFKTANIPIGISSIKSYCKTNNITVIDQEFSTYLSDSALINHIKDLNPDLIGFSIFCWNLEKSAYIAKILKEKLKCKIVFGGSEITHDNYNLEKYSNIYDFLVYGEGEEQFFKLINNSISKKSVEYNKIYSENIVNPKIDNCIYIETQRGCPYNCSFCFYNKSSKKSIFIPESNIVEVINYAKSNKINDIFLLDPSLNVRKDLQSLLDKIIELNDKKSLSFYSELRVEKLNEDLVSKFKKANFKEFEIGLQSTNPTALKLMKRACDLTEFTRGVNLLKKYEISPKVDLILGLPGDTPEGFVKSVDFVYEHEFYDNIQVFPLSILPGTDFRKKANDLSLVYQEHGPYTILKTPEFDSTSIQNLMEYAADKFEIEFYPDPDFDCSYKGEIAGTYFKKIIITKIDERIFNFIDKVTSPYQLIFTETIISEHDFIKKVITKFTHANPFTIPEIILFEPDNFIVKKIESFIELSNEFTFPANDLYYSMSKRITNNLITIVSGDLNKLSLIDKFRTVYFLKSITEFNKYTANLTDFEPDCLLIDTILKESQVTNLFNQLNESDFTFDITFSNTENQIIYDELYKGSDLANLEKVKVGIVVI